MSQTVVHAGQMVLSGVGIEAVANGRSIELARASGIRIVDGCNGLATIGLFAGFVLAFPGSTRRRLLFIPFGIGVIYLANVARISLLAGLQVHWPPPSNLSTTWGSLRSSTSSCSACGCSGRITGTPPRALPPIRVLMSPPSVLLWSQTCSEERRAESRVSWAASRGPSSSVSLWSVCS